MLKQIFRRLNYLKIIHENQNENTTENTTEKTRQTNAAISNNIKENLNTIKEIFCEDNDVNIREFTIGKANKKAFFVNIEGMSEKATVNLNVLKSLMWELREAPINTAIDADAISESMLNVNRIKKITTIEEAVDNILNGDTVLFLDGDNTALDIGTRAWEHRGVEAPQTENSVRGPHEGFTETLRTNTALVRRKIKNPDLKFEELILGRRTRTKVCIVYIKGLANEKILEEVRIRLNSIDIDAILESGYIEEFIKDSPTSPFPTIGNTETPDKFAGKILEGRVGILTEGTPIALTMPYLFIESIQASEDYYSNSFLASQVRLLRIVGLHGSLLLPGIYVALTNFHPNTIPIKLLLTMSVLTETLPFPKVVEALLMGAVFEVLREAGIRMPRPIGQALSIVGALIMGEVAVNAGLVSPLLIIVIALSGMLSFLMPSQIDSVTLLRFPIMIVSAAFGLFGVIWCYILIIIHMCSLRSFGVPYLSPVAPFSLSGLKDFVIRVPWWLMKGRPKTINWRKSKRVMDSGKPGPSKNKVGDN